MRLSDVLASLGAATVFEDISKGQIDLRRYAGPVAWADAETDATAPRFLVCVIGDERGIADSLTSALERWDAANADGMVIVLTSDAMGSLAAGLDGFAERRLQIVSITPLQYDILKAAAVVIHTDDVLVPDRYLDAGSSTRRTLADELLNRLVNEYQIESFGARRARVEVDAAFDRGVAIHRNQVNETEARVMRAERERAARERGSLESTIRTLEQQLDSAEVERAEAEWKLKDLRASVSYRFGRLVADSLRKPFPRLLSLPFDLLRLRRDSGRSASKPPMRSDSAMSLATQATTGQPSLPSSSDVFGEWAEVGGRLWYPIGRDSGTPPSRIAAVTGAFAAPRKRRTWAVLHPNSALQQLEAFVPSILIVDSSAALEGSPWFGAGTSVGLRHDQLLHSLVDRAQHLAIPVVFRWDTAMYRAPQLVDLADRADVVAVSEDGGPDADLPVVPHGVDLLRFNPVGRATSGLTATVLASDTSTSVQTGATAPDLSGGPMLRMSSFTTLPSSALYDPIALADSFRRVAFAILPTDVPATAMREAVACGAIAIGRFDRSFSTSVAASEVNSADLEELRNQAVAEQTRSLATILDRFSILAEEQTLAELTDSHAPVGFPPVTAIIEAGSPEQTLSVTRTLVLSEVRPAKAVLVVGASDSADVGTVMRALEAGGVVSRIVSADAPSSEVLEAVGPRGSLLLVRAAQSAGLHRDTVSDLRLAVAMSPTLVAGVGNETSGRWSFGQAGELVMLSAELVGSQPGESAAHWLERAWSRAFSVPALRARSGANNG